MHLPVLDSSAHLSKFLWNYDDVFASKKKGFSSTTHQDSVLGHWSTHDHVGGYAWNSAWIHHTSITFARVKESINNNYFDTAHLYDKKLILMGTEVYPVFCMYFIKYPIASWTVDDDFFLSNLYFLYHKSNVCIQGHELFLQSMIFFLPSVACIFYQIF